MATQCNETKLIFHDLDSREVVGRFDGGEITSDGGAVLLREVEKRSRLLGRMSECFEDHRDPERIEHTVESLVKQRVMGLRHPLILVIKWPRRFHGATRTTARLVANAGREARALAGL